MSASQRRLAFVLAGVAILAVLFVVLRDGDEASGPPAAVPEPPLPSQPATTETAQTATETEPPTTTAPPASAAQVRVTVRGGRVLGGIRRITLREGRRLVLVVRSDVADEVHVHGYDLSQPITPGAPARIAFRATLPGRFEIELEERGLPIADLQVQP